MDLKSIPWALAKGNRDGQSLMMRYRQFTTDFPKQSYPVRVNLVTNIKEQTQSGLPTQTEYERLGQLEDALMGLIEQDESSVLAMVITSSGRREFIFQTADADAFSQRVNGVYATEQGYSLNIEQESEDDWELIDTYLPKN